LKFEGRPSTFAFLWTLALLSACAVKTAPPLPTALKYPDFVYPSAVPAAAAQAAAVDRGWHYLQNDDLKDADREFAAALKAVPDFVPARTGEGYVALARQDYMRAADQFELALRAAPAYAPALAGASWEFERVGLLTFSMDGEPILGPVAQLPGFYTGLAFHSGGFAYNPAAGTLLAEFVADGHTSIDVSAFSPDRFDPREVDEYMATTVPQEAAVRRRH
jgi:glycine/D-amino acid oxidase-like deaminating enzyme